MRIPLGKKDPEMERQAVELLRGFMGADPKFHKPPVRPADPAKKRARKLAQAARRRNR